MNDTCPLPPGEPPVRDEAAARTRLENLRRFHFGDPSAPRGALPEGVLPAALHSLRGVSVRGGWPLLVDVAGSEEVFGRPLGDWLEGALSGAGQRTLEDNRDRLERTVVAAFDSEPVRDARSVLEAAVATMVEELGLPATERTAAAEACAALTATLPEGARLVAFTRRAPHALLLAAAERRLRRARAAFAGEAQELAAAASAFLESDLARRPDAVTERDRAGRLGALGSRFLDAGRLGGVVAHRRAGTPLAEERRKRLEEARDILTRFDTAPAVPLWVVPDGVDVTALGARSQHAQDPCAAAYAAFDDAAAAVAVLVRAARRVRLETAGEFEPDRHEPGLARLDWRGFVPGELALVPPVLALAREADLLTGQLPSLSRLLLSGRPVQVLVARGSDAAAPEVEGFRFEPGYLGVGHREAFVHQGSVARPQALADGFARALAGSRAALHVVDAPVSAPPDLDPWLVASARLSGRATPLFWYDPEAGASWARRLGFESNPEPAADWPTESLPASAEDAGAPRAAAFTFGDAALLDPAWRLHFAPGAAGDGDLVALADWLGLEAEESARRLPVVWAAGRDGALLPLVVSRSLALAARDRLSFWRSLEELAGVRNEYVDEAVARARAEVAAKAERERSELESRHAGELEQVRAEADAGAVDRIVAALFEVEPQLAGGAAAPRPAARPAPRPAAAPAAGAPAATAEPASSDATTASAGAAEVAEEAWVDTAMCTSCDECTRKFPAIFAYNGDKQAYVKNARGGTFRDLVLAAETCTAKIIHPGSPWDPSEPELAAWVERARKFA